MLIFEIPVYIHVAQRGGAVLKSSSRARDPYSMKALLSEGNHRQIFYQIKYYQIMDHKFFLQLMPTISMLLGFYLHHSL